MSVSSKSIQMCAEVYKAHDLTLVWIPGNNNIEGNELALQAAEDLRDPETQMVYLPFVELLNRIHIG